MLESDCDNTKDGPSSYQGRIGARLLDRLSAYPVLEEPVVAARKLLKWQRFDLLAKSIFARVERRGLNTDWHRRVYLDHLQTFNGLFENDEGGKLGAEAFMGSYRGTIQSIDKLGFDARQSLVPVDADGVLLDGAHRVAAGLQADREVVCARFDTKAPVYDFRWFRERGLSEDCLDAMATELCSLRDDIFVVVIYPTAVGRDAELEELISAHGALWYRKEVLLRGGGPVNLVRQIYWKEAWLGTWGDGFSGARNKASWCFKHDAPVRVFLVESDLPRMLQLKQKVRELFNVENHSIHINDTTPETRQLAGLFLNRNSIEHMNCSLMVERPWFNRMYAEYRRWISSLSKPEEDFCVDGSAVLAAWGLREARDIDFLAIAPVPDSGYKEISCHNQEAAHYPWSIEDMVFNPQLHFFYNHGKFVALSVMREMKLRRGEEKDQHDVRLIDDVLAGRTIIATPLWRRFWAMAKNPRLVLRQAKFLALKVRFLLTQIRKKSKS